MTPLDAAYAVMEAKPEDDAARLRFYERLRRDVPPSVVTLLSVPGLGPRTAGDL